MVDNQIRDSNQLLYYDIILIANPTSSHYQTLFDYRKFAKHFFIDKPLFDHADYDTRFLQEFSESITYVACPLRFHPVISYLKENIQKQTIYSVRIICSSYLPDWRPGVDYRTVYSARRHLGGGVSLDLIHEIDYTLYLFGNPQRVINEKGKYSHLEIDTDDLSVYFLVYPDKIIEIHLDYFGRNRRRELEFFCLDDFIKADLLQNQVQDQLTGKSITFETSDIYLEEMRYFIHCVEHNKGTFNDFNNALYTLKVCGGSTG